ncbi:MAG: hypothetical protein V2A79_10900 [Planctomycetota bacterium]
MPEPFAVAVLTPTSGTCRMAYAQSLARLVMYFAQVRVFPDVPDQILRPDAVEGSGIAENYERMVSRFMADEETHWTHFLSIEDDMAFSPECLHMLASRRLPIVGANYSTNKGSPLRFTAAGSGERVFTTEKSTGVEEVSLLPQGFTLVAREVYDALPKPWYLMGYCPESGNYVYQDYYFSNEARKHGFKSYVDHDVSKLIYHVGPKNYSWRDVVTLDNLYLDMCGGRSDIAAHGPALKRLASDVRHVTEFGTRGGNSTLALLAGRPKILHTWDIEPCPTQRVLEEICDGTNLRFMRGNTLACDIEPTDLLFIDTLHTNGQLSAELERHGGKVGRYIVLHDTVAFGETGEDGGPGLNGAVEGWLEKHPEWKLETRDTRQHGLTVLERIGEKAHG